MKALTPLIFIFLNMVFVSTSMARITACNAFGESKVQMGVVVVPPTAKVGDVIATSGIVYGTDSSIETTVGSWNLYFKYTKASPGQFNTIPTNLEGIGIRGYLTQEPNSYFNYTFTGHCQGLIACIGSVPFEAAEETFELVKTAQKTESGTLTGDVFAAADCDNGQRMATFSLGASSVVSTTCNLETESVSVDLGEYKTSEFTSVGSTTEKKQLQIPVNCDGGGVDFSLGVSSATIADSTNGVIALEPGGATGVGVQIMEADGSTPIPLNGAAWNAGPGVEGENNINLYARYYQLDTKVTSGEANSLATLMFNYH